MNLRHPFLHAFGILSVAVLPLLLWPAGGAGAEKPGTPVVTMTNGDKYVPEKITINVGQTVRWKNTSSRVHTVTDNPGPAVYPSDASLPEGAKPFNSKDIKPGGTYEHTFTVPGSYRYFCIYHEPLGMVGEVVVKAGGGG